MTTIRQSGEKPDFSDGWYMIYPQYIDSSYSIQKGRKISKEYCVESPDALDLLEACQKLKIKVYHEPFKAHPRNPIERIGRVRIKIKGEDIKDLCSKKEVLRKIGATIPSLKNFLVRRKAREKRKDDLMKGVSGVTYKSRQDEGSANVSKKLTNNKKKNRRRRR
eukprot:snap_masked-scaffold_1-processed-gene-27.26-mRNA-1 protein AED:0.26 eAED:0.26 QI:0/-1/0/1/-1/1/1/0/163